MEVSRVDTYKYLSDHCVGSDDVDSIAFIESKPKSEVGVTVMSPIAHPLVSASPALCLSLTGFANSDKNFSIHSSSLNDVSIEVTQALWKTCNRIRQKSSEGHRSRRRRSMLKFRSRRLRAASISDLLDENSKVWICMVEAMTRTWPTML